MAGCWAEERKAPSKKLHHLLVMLQDLVGASTETLLQAVVADSQEG